MRVLQYLCLVSAIVCILGAPNGPAKEIEVSRPFASSSDSSDSSNESLSDDRSVDSSGSVDIEKAAESISEKQSFKSVSSSSAFASKTNKNSTTATSESSLDSNSEEVTGRNRSSESGQSNSGKRDRIIALSNLNTSDETNESSESSSDEIKANSVHESSGSSSGEHKSLESSNDGISLSELSSSKRKEAQTEVNASIHEGPEYSTSNSSKYSTNSSRTDKSKESMENHKLEKSSRSLESEDSENSSIESSSESYAKESTSKDPESQSRSDLKLKTRMSSKVKSINASTISKRSDETNMESEEISECPRESGSTAETKRSEQNVPRDFWEFWEFWESWKKRNENSHDIKHNDLSKAATESSRNTMYRESKSFSEILHKERELDREDGRQLSEQSSDISITDRDFNAILRLTTEINFWKSSTELSLMRLINKINGYALILQNVDANNSDWFRKGCKERQFIIESAIANLNRHVAGVAKNFRHAVIKCNADLKKTATELHANIRNLIESVSFSGNNQTSNFNYITNAMHKLVALTIQNSKIKLLHFYHDNENVGVRASGTQPISTVQTDDRLQRAQGLGNLQIILD